MNPSYHQKIATLHNVLNQRERERGKCLHAYQTEKLKTQALVQQVKQLYEQSVRPLPKRTDKNELSVHVQLREHANTHALHLFTQWETQAKKEEICHKHLVLAQLKFVQIEKLLSQLQAQNVRDQKRAEQKENDAHAQRMDRTFIWNY